MGDDTPIDSSRRQQSLMRFFSVKFVNIIIIIKWFLTVQEQVYFVKVIIIKHY